METNKNSGIYKHTIYSTAMSSVSSRVAKLSSSGMNHVSGLSVWKANGKTATLLLPLDSLFKKKSNWLLKQVTEETIELK
jgi:hypothetical protein